MYIRVYLPLVAKLCNKCLVYCSHEKAQWRFTVHLTVYFCLTSWHLIIIYITLLWLHIKGSLLNIAALIAIYLCSLCSVVCFYFCISILYDRHVHFQWNKISNHIVLNLNCGIHYLPTHLMTIRDRLPRCLIPINLVCFVWYVFRLVIIALF